MIDIPMRVMGAVGKDSVMMINQIKLQEPGNRNTIQGLSRISAANADLQLQNPISQNYMLLDRMDMNIPYLKQAVKKGSKIALESQEKLEMIKIYLGWNVKNPACDVDVSAFLLSGNRVISDDWFVFYGHPQSPDESTVLESVGGTAREVITVDFSKMDDKVEKIVFVLTINEALDKKLNFSMIKDAYIRIVDVKTNGELAAFLPDEYYENITSMMIGEIYKYNGLWKFNAVGNGVAQDLAGLCELYGVEID